MPRLDYMRDQRPLHQNEWRDKAGLPDLKVIGLCPAMGRRPGASKSPLMPNFAIALAAMLLLVPAGNIARLLQPCQALIVERALTCRETTQLVVFLRSNLTARSLAFVVPGGRPPRWRLREASAIADVASTVSAGSGAK